jgi:low affinity Fe/Cu permease
MKESFQRFATKVADAVGSPWAFFIALVIVAAWALSGPVFHFSDTWQLLINTGTTVATFLMVFLIQTTQNRDARAIHLKLDELIRSTKSARNVFADLEHATEEELRHFQEEFKRLRGQGVAHGDAAAKASELLRRPHRHH